MPVQRALFSTSFISWSLVWLGGVGLVSWKQGWFAATMLTTASFLSVWFWTQWQAQRLQFTLAMLDSPLQAIPTAPGLWGEIFYMLHKHNRFWHFELSKAQNLQRNFTLAIQASPNAFVMLDDGGRVEWVNQAAQDLLGLDAARDLGQNLAYLLRTQAVLALLDSQRLREPITLRIQEKCIKVQAFAYGDEQTLLLGQDLTELERTDQVRRDFVANVSHELRTPLTVLTGYTELLQDYAAAQAENLPQAVHEALDHIGLHTQRMNRLTQDLLQLASLDAQAPLIGHDEHARIDLHAWFERMQAAQATLTPHAVIKFDVAHDITYTHGNPSELDSALSNLINNAVRYTPHTGLISVRAQRNGERLHICVEDTGSGIAAEHLPRLTERFYRVSASRSRDSGGTGLGLAIVKHIMLRHQGELLIHSELGKGSRFTLSLPIKTDR